MDTDEKELRYCFAAYLDTALKRERNHYLYRKERRRSQINIDEMVSDVGITFEQTYEEMRYIQLIADEENVKMDAFLEELDEVLRHQILKLKEPEKKVLFLRIYRELSYEEIGKHMNMSTEKVASIYYYVRQKLRRGLENTDGI